MLDIEKVRKLFNEAGLGFPFLPLKFALKIKELFPWCYSKHPIQLWPYNIDFYVHEGGKVQIHDYCDKRSAVLHFFNL